MSMRNFTVAIPILAVGVMLLGSAQAQETPAAKTEQAPAKAQPAAPAKPKTPTTKAGAAKAPAAGASVLKTKKDKFSYALGMNVGANLGTTLRKQSVEFDPNIVAQGLKTSLVGGKTLMTQEEAQALLKEVQADMLKKQQEKTQVAGEANKKEGEAFLAANKGKDGVV